jgi:TolA-binding protein
VSRKILCAALSLGVAGCADQTSALAQAPAQASAEVDPGGKLLLKASGLFNRGMFKPAAQDYETFLKQYPSHAAATSARYALALCHYRLNEYDKAVELIEQVLSDDKFKERDEALAVVGHAQLQSGNFDKSLAAFDELLAKYPSSKHAEVASLNRAQVLYLLKKYDLSVAASDAFLKAYPQSAERSAAMYFQALSQKAQNQNEAAAGTLDGLLKADPKGRYALDATLLLGQSLEAQGKLDEAADQYARMIAIAPAARAADGHYSLGVVLYKSAKYDDAARELSTVVDASPDSPYAKPARLQLGLVQLAGGKTAAARQTLSAVVSSDPAEAPAAQYGLAGCDIADKKYDSAKTILDQLLKQDPPPANLSQIALDHAVCLMELKDYADARSEFAAFVEKDPGTPQAVEATYRQAFCLHKLEKYDESHLLCVQVAGAKSEFAGPATELDAEDLFLLGKYPEAGKLFDGLVDVTKDVDKKRTFTFRLGQCAYHGGDYARAVQVLGPLSEDPAVAQSATLSRAIFLLGDALLQQDKNAEASAALARYVPIARSDKQEAQFKLGLAQLRTGDAANASNARQNFAAAAAGPGDSPWTTRALFELGQFDYKQAPPKLDPARDELSKVLAATPPAPEELAAGATYLLGCIDFDSKKFSDAAAKWAAVQSQYPRNPLVADAQYQQGVALREAGQDEQALAVLKGYTGAHPDGPHAAQAKQLQAACLSKLNRPDEAKPILLALAAGAEAPDSVLYDLAWSQRDTKDLGGAVDTYRRLLKEHPDSKLLPAARGELAELLYNDKKYTDAAELLEAVVTDKSAEARIVNPAAYRLGWCYEKLEKPDKAAAAFTSVAQAAAQAAQAGKSGESGLSDDQVASALLQAGIANASGSKFDEAQKSLSQMLAQFPNHAQAPIALLKLGEVQADAASFDAALQSNNQFLSKYPKDPYAYRAQFGVGWALENLKKYADARDAYAKVIAATNTETAARAQFQTGETFLEEGSFDQALPALLAVEDVYQYPKWSARALFEAGRAYEQLKQPDQARQQYMQVVTKYKDAPEAEMAGARLTALKGS